MTLSRRALWGTFQKAFQYINLSLHRNIEPATIQHTLVLKMEAPPGDPIPDKIFSLLREFLQPQSRRTLESVARLIIETLPDKAPQSREVWAFGESCIEIAEQIPYSHPSQLKLAGLIEYLANSVKLGQVYPSMASFR